MLPACAWVYRHLLEQRSLSGTTFSLGCQQPIINSSSARGRTPEPFPDTEDGNLSHLILCGPCACSHSYCELTYTTALSWQQTLSCCTCPLPVIRLACDLVCEGVSGLFIDVGGHRPLPTVPFRGQVVPGDIKKLAKQKAGMSQRVSQK